MGPLEACIRLCQDLHSTALMGVCPFTGPGIRSGGPSFYWPLWGSVPLSARGGGAVRGIYGGRTWLTGADGALGGLQGCVRGLILLAFMGFCPCTGPGKGYGQEDL